MSSRSKRGNTRIKSGRGNTRNISAPDAGFTVIEMLIAFTILAIVSGSLFQMFFVSAHNNAKAVELDMANGLAITAAEIFKSGKGLDGAEMFAVPQGAVTGRTWRSAGGDRYIKYYDAGWREIEMALPAVGFEAETPESSRFVLEAEVGESPVMGSELNYIAASLSLSLNTEQEYRLVINERTDEIEAVFNGIPHKMDKPRVGSVISVNFEFTREGALPKHIAVVNRTGFTVNVNVFGVPGESVTSADVTSPDEASADGASAYDTSTYAASAYDTSDGAPDIESRGGYIEVSPVTGPIAVMYLDEYAHTADSVMRTIKITVRGAPPSGSEMVNIEASVYIPG